MRAYRFISNVRAIQYTDNNFTLSNVDKRLLELVHISRWVVLAYPADGRADRNPNPLGLNPS